MVQMREALIDLRKARLGSAKQIYTQSILYPHLPQEFPPI